MMMQDEPASLSAVPRSAATLGMWLFLAALFMLFASSLLGYVAIRRQAARQGFGPGAVQLPALLWLSTVVVIGVSVAMARALRVLRQARRRAYRSALTAALALAVGFVTIQTPALAGLLVSNASVRQAAAAAAATRPGTLAPAGTALHALVFFLVLVHALHVAGGIAALLRLTLRARRGDDDPTDIRPVRHAAMYWHFLDAVWVAMFLTFHLLG